MKSFALCGSLVAIAAFAVACSDSPTPATSDGGGAGTDAGSQSDASTGVLGFRPSNFDGSAALEAALKDATLGDVELSDCGPQVVGSENGRLGCGAPGENYKQIDGSGAGLKYAVFVAKNVHIAADKILEVGGERPVVIIALESIVIDGSIQVKEGFSGAYPLGNAQQDGAGPGAGKGSSNTTSGSGGGGGFCGKGGNGGAATALGGPSYGSPELLPLQGGSTGGALFAAEGGGAIQLVAGREIVLKAGSYIDARGGGAVAGGGSGGAILIEAPTVKISGSVTANGGGGGAPGGQGGTPGGRTATPALGGRNAENINGGDGGAGATANGTNGVLSPTPGDGSGSASGGGAAGRIRINTRSGAAEVSGLVSPSLGSACGTQGTLR
jgi:hypothetical protein